MYSRYPNYRFNREIKVPENYSGVAFASEIQDIDSAPSEQSTPPPESEPPTSSDDSVSAAVLRQDPSKCEKRQRSAPFGFRFDIGRLFSGGFGFEELLILAMMAMIFMSEGETDNELILLLGLLLFAG